MTMRRSSMVAIFSLQFFLMQFCSTPARAVLPASASFMTRPVIIPIEIISSGHIAIRARINGHGPYRFIFDTGAPMLLVSENVARDARILPPDFTKPFLTPLGNLGDFKIHSIVLGRAVQANLTANVWNHPTVEELSRAFGRFEGLIGYPFFAHYQVTIDYKAKTMTLVPSPFQPTDTKEKMTRKLLEGGAEKLFSPSESIGIQINKTEKDRSPGVDVSVVMPRGPADEAGIKTGDRLLTLDGRWTDSVEDCYAALDAVTSPRPVTVTLLREGRELTILVKLNPAI